MKEIKVGLIGFGTVGLRCGEDPSGECKSDREKGRGENYPEKDCGHRSRNRSRRKAKTRGPDPKGRGSVEDPEIDIVMELMGGIEPAKSFILKAIQNRKHIVTANKALLALHGDEIFRAAERYGVDVNFEASVGGGIPIIRSVKEGLVANRIQSIFGILNGTSNYILSKMTDEGRNFQRRFKRGSSQGVCRG